MSFLLLMILFTGLLIYWETKIYILITNPFPKNKANKYLIWLEIAVIIITLAQLYTGWMCSNTPPMWAQIGGGAMFSFGVFIATAGRIWLDGEYAPACKMAPPKQIIMDGPYQKIRHPIYSGTMLMGLGFELALYSPLIPAVVMLIPLLAHQANKEENLIRHLPEWQTYAQKTCYKFIPLLY